MTHNSLPLLRPRNPAANQKYIQRSNGRIGNDDSPQQYAFIRRTSLTGRIVAVTAILYRTRHIPDRQKEGVGSHGMAMNIKLSYFGWISQPAISGPPSLGKMKTIQAIICCGAFYECNALGIDDRAEQDQEPAKVITFCRTR